MNELLNSENVLIGESGNRYFVKLVENGLVYYSQNKERKTRIQGVDVWLNRMSTAKIERRK